MKQYPYYVLEHWTALSPPKAFIYLRLTEALFWAMRFKAGYWSIGKVDLDDTGGERITAYAKG